MIWNLETLEGLIENKVEENLNLDYKAAGSLERSDNKTNEISKDISAFANSDGGVIIYGIKEDKENKHLPESIDPLNRKIISKEWLEQIIQSKIRPRIEGIRIFPISINNDEISVVYVVEIPQSNTAHQADDKKYYKRFNFNSIAMYDYEIRDILNRAKLPLISLEFEISSFEYTEDDLNADKIKIANLEFPKKVAKNGYKFDIYANNYGNVFVNYLRGRLIIPKSYLRHKYYNSRDEEFCELWVDNTIRDVVDVQFTGFSTNNKYGPSRYNPILPKLRMRLDTIEFNDLIFNNEIEINWEVYADNAEMKTGTIKIRRNETYT